MANVYWRQNSTVNTQSSSRWTPVPTKAVWTSHSWATPVNRSVRRVTERLFQAAPPGELKAKSVPTTGASSMSSQMMRTEHQVVAVQCDSAVKVATRMPVWEAGTTIFPEVTWMNASEV